MTRAADIGIAARDGFRLAATMYRPVRPSERVAVISSATAVPRRFYRHFAVSLADTGFTTITYDYRGIGESKPVSLRGFDARTRDWALLDMAGVIDFARSELSPRSIVMVGHSVGGQVAGLLDNADQVDGMLTLSAQSGHWRLQGGEQKYLVALHVHLTLPLLAKTLGYMPWSWLGSAEDLPAGAALEWSRWCRHRDYLMGDATLPLERFGQFTAPVRAYSIDDDKWGTARSVDNMMANYPNVDRKHIVPAEHGLETLGHFGYFRPASSALWPEAIGWLDEVASG